MIPTVTRDGSTNGAGTIEVVCRTRLLRSRQGKRKGATKEKVVKKAEEKRDLVTFAMLNVKHPVAHWPKIGEGVTPNKEKK